jgi:hypothetical protein
LALPASGQPPFVLAWGEELRLHALPGGKVHNFPGLGKFGPGGCLVDVDQDGLEDLVVNQLGSAPGDLGRMVWLRAPDWQLRQLDSGADFRDCMPATMFGKRGVLLIHRQSQVRFYEIPRNPLERWPYQEIYSIYTPSAQGGLLRADIDADGETDILAGNYWIQSPPSADLSWRLFAINNWWQGPRSAMLRLALARPSGSAAPVLFAAQSEASPARLAWFEPPPDRKQMWTESPLEAIPPLRPIGAIAVADLNGDLRPDLAAAENDGEGSRLLVYWSLGGGRYQATRIDVTSGLIGLWAFDYDGDGRTDLIGLGPHSLSIWKNQRLR